MKNSVEPLAYPIRAWCKAVGHSIRHFYDLEKRGQAPRTFWIGGRRYVSKITGEAWLAEQERNTA